MKKLVLLFFLFSFGAQAQRFVTTYNTIADLLAAPPPGAQTNAYVLGYYTANDGGGGPFTYFGSSAVATNQGAYLKPNNYNGRWFADFTIDGGNVNVKRFGAKGDYNASTLVGTDDTLAIQSAIDFAESRSPVIGVLYPAGNYLFSTLLVKSAAQDGMSQENLHTLGSPQMGARLTQKIGATNHGIIIRANHLSAVRISNLALVGNREDNLKNPFTITSASTRTNFVVNAGSGTWPTAPASPSTWPYYGYCFFFTSENKYAGAGLVVNRNTGTGAIDLMPFTDTYATVTNNSYLLSAGWKVCFAEVTTELAGYKSTTGIDSSLAGYNGIHIESDSVNKLVTRLQLKNLALWHWHTGIRMGNTLANTLKDIWIGTASFAGIAGAFPGDNRDDFLDNVFVQGYWLRSNNTIPETLVLENKSLRKTLWGYYGLTSSGNMEMTTLDNTVNGLFVKDCLEAKVGALHIDGPMQNGIWFGGGLTDAFRSQTTFGSVVMRNINLASDLLVGPVNNNPYYAINVFGLNNSAVINELDVTKFGANNRYYTAAIHAPVANGLHINNLYTVAGATNMFSATTTGYPTIANYRENTLKMRPIVNGVSPYLIEHSQFTATVPMVASNTFNVKGQSTLEGSTYQLGRFRVGTNVSVSKFQIFQDGFNATDSMGIFHNWGANSATGDDRTDLTAKEFRIYNYGYTNANPKFTVLWGNGQQANNRVWIGGGDNSAETASDIRVYTGTKGQLGGTNHFQIDGSGNIIIPDAARFRFTDSSGNMELTGNGSPEGVQTARRGSTYRRKDGGASTTFYVKESGDGLNTGWVAYGPAGGGGAPSTADYLVKTADGGLSAERVVTDTTSITVDWATGGQAKFVREALTGDVTAAQNGNATTIANDVVSNAKMANMAASTIKARVTGSTGDPEDATLSQVLDLVGSAADGDILVRSGGSWGRLAAPTGVFPSTLYNGPDGFEWVSARTHYLFTEDWIYHGLVGYAGWGSGGNNANIASEAQASGIMGVSTSTSATGTRALTPNSANLVFGEGKVVGQFRCRIPTLSTNSERFTVVVGFIDGEGGGADGAYFRYVDNVSGGDWETCTESNNSITATDSTVVATTDWTNFQIVVNAAANEVKFYINGTLVRTETATIPTGAARATSFGFGIAKSVGTTQRDFYNDYMQVYKQFTTAR